MKLMPRHKKILEQIRSRSCNGMPVCMTLLCQATGISRMLIESCRQLQHAGFIKWIDRPSFSRKGWPSGWHLTPRGREYMADQS